MPLHGCRFDETDWPYGLNLNPGGKKAMNPLLASSLLVILLVLRISEDVNSADEKIKWDKMIPQS